MKNTIELIYRGLNWLSELLDDDLGRGESENKIERALAELVIIEDSLPLKTKEAWRLAGDLYGRVGLEKGYASPHLQTRIDSFLDSDRAINTWEPNLRNTLGEKLSEYRSIARDVHELLFDQGYERRIER